MVRIPQLTRLDSKIYNDYMNPFILEERKLNVAQLDVFSRLMANRIIFLGTEIDDYVSNVIQAQLLYLDSLNNDEISIYINSPGGEVYSGLGIYDTMKLIKSPIKTVCTGLAASMAAILLASGNTRFALPHSRIMIHQPLGGVSGQASDIEIETKEILRIKQEMIDILVLHSNQSIDTIKKDCDRDFWMTSNEALDYGLIDKVL